MATDSGTVTVTVPVKGMTCRSCEVRIARQVGRLPGVQKATASAVRGQVVVESSAPLSPAALEQAPARSGYELGRTPWLASDPTVWLTAGAGVLLVAALAVIAQLTGVADLASGAGELSSGGLVVALLLGLAAGVSTCAALVGGLVLGLSAAFGAGRSGGEGATAQMRPALVFVAGRVAGYAVLGAALGAVGATITMPPQLTAALMITVALVMMVLGARLTGLSPRVAGWSPMLPMGLGARLGLGDGRASAYSDRRAAALGAASFFLPCGFTQAVQIYAISTGSPLFAAALLGTFAIGTAPGLLALAGLPVVVPSRTRPTLLRLVGVVVLGFAVLGRSAAGDPRRRWRPDHHDLPGCRRLQPGEHRDLRGPSHALDGPVLDDRHLRRLPVGARPRHPRPAQQGREHLRAARPAGRNRELHLLDGDVRRAHHGRRSPGRLSRRLRARPAADGSAGG